MADLISVASATECVAKFAARSDSVSSPLRDALGQVLAESIVGDGDVPAYDKSLVDGYAVRAEDFDNAASVELASEIGSRAVLLDVIETVHAGQVPQRRVGAGQATRIMTGAPIPDGANAVVMVEQTSLEPGRVDEGECVSVLAACVSAGQHIMQQGTAYRAGRQVVAAGKILRPIEIGVLAELGVDPVKVVRRPTVALIQTGDELVAPSQIPAAGQIRNSNGHMLESMVVRAGGEVRNLGIIRDSVGELQRGVELGLREDVDVFVLSGGVSQGEKDFVPGILCDAGVECVFHKVNVRPGKPIWFGVRKRPDGKSSTLVFGLPGNPISGFVCFLLFVAPTLAAIAGRDGTHARRKVRLKQAFALKGPRPAFWPASTDADADAQLLATPLPWQGSADSFTLVNADCLVYFPSGNRSYAVNETLDCIWLS